jgi:hypothetical protein
VWGRFYRRRPKRYIALSAGGAPRTNEAKTSAEGIASGSKQGGENGYVSAKLEVLESVQFNSHHQDLTIDPFLHFF